MCWCEAYAMMRTRIHQCEGQCGVHIRQQDNPPYSLDRACPQVRAHLAGEQAGGVYRASNG